MHGCFCLHPFKFLILLIIHIYYHLLGCYWIKFPLFHLSGFWLTTFFGISGMFAANFHADYPCKKLKSESPKNYFLYHFLKCATFSSHQPVLFSTIYSTHMLLMCDNLLWLFYCDCIPTLTPSNLTNTFSHFITENLWCLTAFL